MPDAPFFSVVIPTYNRELTIRETLESVARQTFRDFETIVVDDGSSDRTVDLIRNQFPWVQAIQQENAGPGAARNRGATTALGTYLAFLDSDDLWFPWTLKRTHELLVKLRPASFIILNSTEFIDSSLLDMNYESPIKYFEFPDYYASHSRRVNCAAGTMVVKRTSFQKVGGFPAGCINAEDADLALRLGEEYGFVHITHPQMVAYRRHPGNISNDVHKLVKGATLLLDNEYSHTYPGGHSRRLAREEILGAIIRPIVVKCIRHHSFYPATLLYTRTFLLHIHLRNFKYLAGAPLIAVFEAALGTLTSFIRALRPFSRPLLRNLFHR